MPSSIVLSNLALSTPDGRALLSGIDLSLGLERTGLVGRNGVGKTTLLKVISGELPPQAGAVAVGGTLAVVRQSILIEPDETVADLFGVTDALALLRRAEAGQATGEELAEADWTIGGRVVAALARVGLEARTDTRLVELSGGQATRANLAAAIYAEPDFLLLDEPTNNLDRSGRDAVIKFLSGWRAGAIVISHDRELLEHMDAIVELTSRGATKYGGNWGIYCERKAIELDAARHDLALAEKRVAEVKRKVQVAAERKDRRDAAGARKGARGDLPRILTGARKSNAQASRGEAARLSARRQAQAQEAAATLRARVEILQELSVELPRTGLAASRTVLKIDRVTVGYDANRPIIRDLSFSMIGPQRVAVAGPNGSGKTTLLRLIAGHLRPFNGTVSVMVDFAMLDQRVSILDPQASILDNFKRLTPGSSENDCRSALARFLFRADDALQRTRTLSGGQMLRAGLACVLGAPHPPSLLILDEPTNHLDIDSLVAVEAGLRAFDGALLVVSHDEAFLEGIGVSHRLDLPFQNDAD